MRQLPRRVLHRSVRSFGVRVPVHAEFPEIDAVLLDGFDDKANVLGAKAPARWETAARTPPS
jgi:hypothetical protein